MVGATLPKRVEPPKLLRTKAARLKVSGHGIKRSEEGCQVSITMAGWQVLYDVFPHKNRRALTAFEARFMKSAGQGQVTATAFVQAAASDAGVRGANLKRKRKAEDREGAEMSPLCRAEVS